MTMDADKFSYFVIRRHLDDGTTEDIHSFPGSAYDLGQQVYRRMADLYAKLPEFPNNYFQQHYKLTRVYFDTDKVLDRYPEV